MKRKKNLLLFSVFVFLAVWFAPLQNVMPQAAQRTLALSLLTVIWWAFKVVPQAYTSLLLIAGLLLFRVAEPTVVLTLWTRPLVWLIICAFLISAAVSKTGLARRFALFLMSRFSPNYAGTVVMIYLIGLLMSLFIPQTFPRLLILIAVVREVIRLTDTPPKTAVALGFAVFSSQVATSMFFLTGDAILNLSVVEFSGVPVSWMRWLTLMGVPALAVTLVFLGLQFLVFGSNREWKIDRLRLQDLLRQNGSLSRPEKTTLIWVCLALLLWATDSLTGIDPAWSAVAVVVGLALPGIGGVLTVDDLMHGVSWPVILFVTGAFALGAVSTSSGLSGWLVDTLLPAAPPQNPYTFTAVIVAGAMSVHMLVGSVMASLSVTAPAMLAYAAQAGWNPLFPALVIYTMLNAHFLLPFHNIALVLGDGELGGYSAHETIRFGLPLTAATWVIILLVEIPWWSLLGLIQ